jgi:hypothetical protein
MGFLAPALPAIGTIAGGLFGGRSGPSQQTAQQVPTLPPALQQLFNTTQGAATQDLERSGTFDPNQDLARGLIGSTLSGQFLDPFNNPGLQNILQRGADTIGQQTNTRFGSAGRDVNSTGGLPVFADRFGSFTGDVLFNNFNAERGRQDAALNQVSNFNPIDQFIRRTSGLPGFISGQNTTVPLHQDRLAGFLGGAGAGRQAGEFLGGLGKQGANTSSAGQVRSI